jgi:hypothetical protein
MQVCMHSRSRAEIKLRFTNIFSIYTKTCTVFILVPCSVTSNNANFVHWHVVLFKNALVLLSISAGFLL